MVLCKHPKKNLICLEKKITHQQMENKPKTIWDEIRVLLQASYKKSAKYTDQHKKKIVRKRTFYVRFVCHCIVHTQSVWMTFVIFCLKNLGFCTDFSHFDTEAQWNHYYLCSVFELESFESTEKWTLRIFSHAMRLGRFVILYW